MGSLGIMAKYLCLWATDTAVTACITCNALLSEGFKFEGLQIIYGHE